jgi:hypothetical protein
MSCLVSSGRQECQKEENGQQEVAAALQVMPADQDLPEVLLEVKRDQLTVLPGQQEVPTEGLAVPAAGQDAEIILQEELSDMQPVLLEAQRDQLTVLAGQQEVPAEGLAVPATGQDATTILHEVLAGEQDMQPVLLEVPPEKQDGLPALQKSHLQSKTSHQLCKAHNNSSWRWRGCRERWRKCRGPASWI